VKTTKHHESNWLLAMSALGSLGLALSVGGCFEDASDGPSLGSGDTDVTEPEASSSDTGTGAVEEETEETGTGTTGGPLEDETTGDETTGGESTGEEEEEPPLEGPGCGVQPVCDKGTYQGNLLISDDDSAAALEGYSHITGYLTVRESEFTCLDFLACLESARGLVVERNDDLVNLDGLGSLEEVPFLININRNASLRDVSGLSSLSKLSSGGDDVQLGLRGLVIFENPSLETVSGFDALQELEGDISITNNASMVEVSAFPSLTKVAKHPNPNKGPGQPSEVAGSLVVSSNKSMERINGFSELSVIDENLVIQYNDVLTELTGLHGLQAIGGALIITNNPALCISEAYLVGGELDVGPLDLTNSSTANNQQGC
jgi:hypothetical protein